MTKIPPALQAAWPPAWGHRLAGASHGTRNPRLTLPYKREEWTAARQVLLVIGSAHLDAGDLGDGVGLVCSLKACFPVARSAVLVRHRNNYYFIVTY